MKTTHTAAKTFCLPMMLAWKIWLVSNLLCDHVVQSRKIHHQSFVRSSSSNQQPQHQQHQGRELQTATPSCEDADQDDLVPEAIESYFVVDLVGFPLTINSIELEELASNFVTAYNKVKSDSLSTSTNEDEAAIPCIQVRSAEIVYDVNQTLIATIPNPT